MVTGYNPLGGNKTGKRVRRNQDTAGWAGTSAAQSIARGLASRNTPEKAAYTDAYNRKLRSLGPTQPGQNNAALAQQMLSYDLDQMAAATPTGVPMRRRQTGGSGGGGYGGGGGGGPTEAELAQGQIDYLMKMLGSGAFKAKPMDAARQGITNASAQDMAAVGNRYGELDTWLGANQTNPYANVQLQQARAAPDQNPYLASQGVGALNNVQGNPEDTGYGGAQNLLALLGANQQRSNQSNLLQSQLGRTFAGDTVGASENAMLANVGNQEYAAQQALDTQRLQVLMQLAALVGQGGTAPDLSALGL